MSLLNIVGSARRESRRSSIVDMSRRRRMLAARGIERAITDADRFGHLPIRPLARPNVVLEARPALQEIARVLRDENRDVSPAWQERVHWFMTEGSESPLYGSSPADARLEAERLAAAA
jgi:hypothetical protein